MRSIFVILALIAVCCMQSTNAVKCYKCRSWTDPDCANDKFNSKSHIVDCDLQTKPNTATRYNPVTKCHKIVTKDAVSQITSRDCHFEAVGEKPDVCTIQDGLQLVSCNVCSGDICNGSSGARTVLSFGFMSLLVFVALTKIF